MNKPYEVFKKVLSSKNNIRIKLLGDSLTHGLGGVGFEQDGEPIVGDYARNPNGYCWANLFTKYMKEKYNSTVINNACTGADIQHIINNYDVLVDKEDDIIICAIGTNNRTYYGQWGPTPTREEFGRDFYNHIVNLYNMIKDDGKDVIFIANIPLCPEGELDGETYIQLLHMDDINAIYKKAAENTGFPLISLYELFSEYYKTNNIEQNSLYWDGRHPNDRGYEVIFNLIINELGLN